MSHVIDFMVGFAVGVLCIFGALGLALAWARYTASRWLSGIR